MKETIINELNYLNKKKILINELNDWLSKSDFSKNKKLINEELIKKNIFLHDKKYYRNLIFFSKSENILDEIDLEIIFSPVINLIVIIGTTVPSSTKS